MGPQFSHTPAYSHWSGPSEISPDCAFVMCVHMPLHTPLHDTLALGSGHSSVAGQSVQILAPSWEYLPLAHSLHACSPDEFLYVPMAHGEHNGAHASGVFWKFVSLVKPALHEHTPSSPACEPGWQHDTLVMFVWGSEPSSISSCLVIVLVQWLISCPHVTSCVLI